ncbi:MAG: dockerin type I repeat-containing protein [Acutalibacteraceae bacterium]
MNRFIKAGISIAAAAAIAASAAAVSFATDYMGDVNDDGAVNSSDALAILTYAVGNPDVTINLKKADLNADGLVNSSDALQVLKVSVGLADLTEYVGEDTPADYDKAEIVKIYNDALKKAYASEKVTINKKTDVDVKISQLTPKSMLDLANNLIKENAVPTDETKTFNSNPTEAQKFLVPTALEADGAKEAKVEETENGFKITITLVKETVDYKTAPKYNTQASLPLTGIANQADKYGVKVTSSSLEYVGTVITAELDKDGNITSLNHTMDLNIAAKAEYGLFTKIEGKGSGRYTLDATFTY